MRDRFFILVNIVFLFLFSPYGCEKQDTGEEIPGPGKPSIQNGILNVWATDAPFPVDMIKEARVTVDKLDIRQQDDTAFQNISSETVSFDLLALRNGIMESLATGELVPGVYDQLRMRIDHASILLKDGRTNVLKVPGGPQAGLKVNFDPPIRIYPGMVANVLLDFNLSRSFILTGNPKSPNDIRGFNFKPVVRVAVIDSTGMIAGSVNDMSGQPLANAEVYISTDSIVASTFSNHTGAFAILGIPEGMYRVTAAVEGYVAQETGGIQISAMEKTLVDFLLAGTK